MNFLLVFLGGGIGSAFRYLISTFFYNESLKFPLATFVANLLGSLMIGLLIGYSIQHTNMSQQAKLLLITGFCGGFTTFSTFSSESLFLFQNNMINTAIFYVLLSVVGGLLMTFLGLYFAKMI